MVMFSEGLVASFPLRFDDSATCYVSCLEKNERKLRKIDINFKVRDNASNEVSSKSPEYINENPEKSQCINEEKKKKT